jgi:hypothetical protein
VFTSENSTPTELSPEESDIVGFGECFAREILGMVCVEGTKTALSSVVIASSRDVLCLLVGLPSYFILANYNCRLPYLPSWILTAHIQRNIKRQDSEEAYDKRSPMALRSSIFITFPVTLTGNFCMPNSCSVNTLLIG